MREVLPLVSACLVLFGTPALADLCTSVQDTTTTAESKSDVDFYEELFPNPEGHGSRRWNEIIVQCNRQRDTKGNEIRETTAQPGNNTGKNLLRARNLEPKVIRGHFNFFGTIVTQLKYVYVLSKQDGVWTMVIPYRPVFNELVADRVDFFVGYRDINVETNSVSAVSRDGHAWQFYDASQVVRGTAGRPSLSLKPSAQPIAVTLCSGSTYFPGDSGKYDGKSDANAYKRDKENKFISTGQIQYRYKDQNWLSEGCRVEKSRDLYWRNPAGDELTLVKPQDWILDNFRRTAESYWSIDGTFELKLLLKGRNDRDFPQATLGLLRDDDHLTIRFATQFLPYHYNQMYKSNIIQFNNFSTMTTDETYWHEVGHAFGLDDEYGGEKKGVPKENSCENAKYAAFSPTNYQMCEAGADDDRTIYHYIAASRYVTKQSECAADGDCGDAEYCDKGTITIGKNQCVPKKADNAACDVVGGGHQCQGGRCAFGRCYTPDSVAMGGTCYVDAACDAGKCSAIDGARGTCVCQEDGDCPAGRWCNAGLDLAGNSCLALKADNEPCDVVGGGHQCKGGKCAFSRCYTPDSVAMGGTCYVDAACDAGKCSAIDGARGTCVCQEDGDCGTGKWCNAGLDLAGNSCLALKADNEPCDVVGGGHQCKGGKCAFSRCYTADAIAMGGTCYVDAACDAGKCSAVDGARGTCVCQEDRDCGTGKYCDAGFDAKLNACRAKLDKGETCGKALSVGNDHKCKSGKCSGAPFYKCT